MATIKDVAELAGVSVATVSRYITNNGYVGKKSRENIAKAISTLNYTPSEVARSLYSKTSKLIGLLVPQIDNPFFSIMIQGVESVCKQNGYQLLISHVYNQKDILKYIDSFSKNNIAGVISAIECENKLDINFPIVGVDRARDNYDYCVYFDDYNGGKISAQAVVDGGCKKVLVNVGPEYIDVAIRRFQGVKDVLQNNNIEYTTYKSDSYGYKAANSFVDYLDAVDFDFDTIIACNDLHALSAALLVQRKGLKIPDEVQIIGYDDIIFSKVFNPKLATISHSGSLLGETSAEMLIKLIEKKEIENKKIKLDEFLVENSSLRKSNVL